MQNSYPDHECFLRLVSAQDIFSYFLRTLMTLPRSFGSFASTQNALRHVVRKPHDNRDVFVSYKKRTRDAAIFDIFFLPACFIKYIKCLGKTRSLLPFSKNTSLWVRVLASFPRSAAFSVSRLSRYKKKMFCFFHIQRFSSREVSIE